MDINKIISDSFATTYSVELLYNNIQVINSLKLLSELRKEFGNVEILFGTESMITFMFLDYSILCDENEEIPLQFIIMNKKNNINKVKLNNSLLQTRDWEVAKSIVEACNSTINISDFMADRLNYKLRVELFNKFLNIFIKNYEPKAINWLNSQKIVDPNMLKKSYIEEINNIYGQINVRYFKNNNEIIMDTIGLSSLGLPDIQCHFKKLDHGQIAFLLFNIAKSIFEKGDYIEDGFLEYNNFINQKITFYHELSMVDPLRLVIDIELEDLYKGKRE